MNPPWRTRVNGRLKIGGAGPWETLHRPGQNGFLSVLQCLSWWRVQAGTEGMEDWDTAVDDVLWVLNEVLSSQIILTNNSKCGRKRGHDELSSGDVHDASQVASYTRNHKPRDKRIPKR